jgi:hypothetical protein
MKCTTYRQVALETGVNIDLKISWVKYSHTGINETGIMHVLEEIWGSLHWGFGPDKTSKSAA